MPLTCLSEGLNCFSKNHDPDPLVNVKHKFNITFAKKYFGDKQFETNTSYHNEMENRFQQFTKLAKDESFWNMVASHTDMEDTIKLGIPPEFRSKMWQTLAGVSVTAAQIDQYYMLRDADNPQRETIEKDLERTFDVTDSVFYVKLFRVLIAYANYNPTLGYTQSMNYLAGTLLIFMEEEHAFWMLVHMLDRVVPGFHTTGFPGYYNALEIFKFLLGIELPELYNHFQNIDYDVGSYASAWFLGIYINVLPAVTAFWVWDNVMLNGKKVILEVALAMLRFLEQDLLNLGFDETMMSLPKRLKKIFNPTKLLKYWKPVPADVFEIVSVALNQMQADIPRAAALSSRYGPNAHFFTTPELTILWLKFASKNYPHRLDDLRLDYAQFKQFIAGTFGEWYPEREHLRHLFRIIDRDGNERIDFMELVEFLFVTCRGSLTSFSGLNMKIFDVNQKGWLDRTDLSFFLHSLYGMYAESTKFDETVDRVVEDLLVRTDLAQNGVITKKTFHILVLAQSRIHEQFTKLNPSLQTTSKSTYIHWMTRFSPPNKHKIETIGIVFSEKKVAHYLSVYVTNHQANINSNSH